MTRRAVAVLGLGETGTAWARAFHAAGWSVRAFDPSELAGDGMPKGAACRRLQTISATVRDAAWIVVALPQRLELVQKVIQRAQAEAPEDAIVIATAGDLDLDAMQAPARRPERVVLLRRDTSGGIALQMTRRNDEDLRDDVLALLSQIESDLDLPLPRDEDQGDDAAMA